MLQGFCIPTTEAEAEGVVSRILETGIPRENIFIAAGFSEMDHIAVRDPRAAAACMDQPRAGSGDRLVCRYGDDHPARASKAIPRTGEALLIPLNTALIGMVLGTVAGASGVVFVGPTSRRIWPTTTKKKFEREGFSFQSSWTMP